MSPPSSIPSLIDAFFQHVYPLPSYAFLHPPTILRKLADDSIDRSLVIAIAAVSSVRAPGIQRSPSLESAWVQEAETLIWQHLESPSIARLQAMLLVILYRAETGQLRRAFMLASLAGRAATALRLNYERPDSSATSLEVRRRLMWSLKLVERYFSVGLPEFELCPVENIYIQLPCVEYQFSSDGGDWRTLDDQGSYHISVKLEMFRRDVMKLNRSLALCDQPFPSLPKMMNDFQQHLDRIGMLLPDGVEPTQEQLERWITSQWLPRYLIMRLSFHQIHIDLYRLVLRKFRDAAPRVVLDALEVDFLDRAEAMCIHHAKMSVHTIATMNSTLVEEPTRLLEFDTAICAYTASRMLLFTARFGQTSERPTEEFALSRANMCLAVVQRFFPRSMLVRPIIDELRRLIGVFSSHEQAPSRFSSPKLSGAAQERDLTTQLSSAARIRQRLAIHSLLRQANFVDEEDEQTDSRSAQRIQPNTTTSTSQAAVADTPMTDDSPETQGENQPWAQWLFEGQAPENDMQPVNLNQRSFVFPWLTREESNLASHSLSR
ncbi:uncharacterized protein F5Z01DRAFT_679063 [Emericellopsis atlantica]|uniref:Xylanolytic transcriptional activator regulatory domain-containing protein n=1 Tax=Emericellopsis atlantica TaxID=2614577 RepID=A0A9P8CSS2_9HYPO|nr:uncharacterized protein F5Z01DRAFT_679063 [Emericellopsis atlantica]KAG9258389.1 hypothetical protein F5Z01DRAFT_679063 [Emericellopsis atlantica]